MDQQVSLNEALLFNLKISHLSKALWKTVERDWQQWLKPYDLNINEHHILGIAYQLDGASISDIAAYGVMHVSTAFNFSKKLEKRNLVEFSKSKDDKRNTYINITEEGKKLLANILQNFQLENNAVLSASVPLMELYGRYPELIEMKTIVKNIYGEDFIEIFELSVSNMKRDLAKHKDEI